MTRDEFIVALQKRGSEVGVPIPDGALESLSRYFELLTRWNQTINLTALPLSPPTVETLDRLFLEPIAASALVPDRRITLLDVGSGGGSPAIPLRVIRPGARLILIEAKSRKAAFLRETLRLLGFDDALVLEQRFEVVAANLEFTHAADVVTARAVRLERAALSALEQFLTPDGRLIVFAGAEPPAIWDGLRLVRSVSLPGQNLPAAHMYVPRGT